MDQGNRRGTAIALQETVCIRFWRTTFAEYLREHSAVRYRAIFDLIWARTGHVRDVSTTPRWSRGGIAEDRHVPEKRRDYSLPELHVLHQLLGQHELFKEAKDSR